MHRAAPVLAALATLTWLTGCGSDADHNDADVEFATAMIEHHAQAIQMANFTIGREGLDPEIAALAEQIRVDQTEEIDTMSAWLEEWGEPVPETGFATGDGHTHSESSGTDDHGDMPGMASGAAMDALAEAPDAEFEERWLAMMVEHHEGAVAMAEEVADSGESPEVDELAGSITAEQQAEIEEMTSWLEET
jgi:uncharacterized protein (DUF305 family)